jgi:hypothetical protein
LAEEALVLHRTLGDARGVALSLWSIGADAVEERDWEKATDLLTESLRLFREIGDRHFVPWITRTLAWTAAASGDLVRGRDLYEEGLVIAREIGSRSAEAALLGSLGWMAVLEGRPRDALPIYLQSLTLKREIGDRGEIHIGLAGTALALAHVGELATSARLVSATTALREELGVGEAWVAREKKEALTLIHGQLDEASFAEAWEEGARLTLDEAIDLALRSVSEGTEAQA